LLSGRKWAVVALLCGSHIITFVIRVSLGVVAPTLMSLYAISPAWMGLILSGYSWSYMACLLLAGFVVDRFGPRLVMGLGSVVWGLATVCFSLLSTSVPFLVMRGLFGLGHSMMIPAGAASISHWVGPNQRATAIGLTFAGGTVGLAIGTPTAAFLLHQFGWQWVFYCIGGASLIFTVLWFALYPRERFGPQAPLEQEQKTDTEEVARVSWAFLLSHRSTWGIALGQMGYLYAYFFFVTWLPGYLILERKMTILETGFVASLPFLMGMMGTIGGGWLGDSLIQRGMSPTICRKAIIGTGLTLAMLMVVGAAFTTESWSAVTLLTLCMGCLRMTTASSNSIPIDLAPPNAVASLASIQSLGGNTGGLLAPIMTGYIVQTTGSFVGALVFAGGMALFGAISYVFVTGPLEPFQLRVASRS
ncbi:MFS transporter, partial [Acidobacteria bacterium AH-259-D05]|nr:MFS transporter [Acidobacteria bacterium AH-259-D05]